MTAGKTLSFLREIDGIPVWIQKKNIGNLYLRIDSKNGQVKVSLPLTCPDSAAEELVRKHREWIQKKQAQIAGCADLPASLRNEERPALWGEPFTLEPVSYTGKRPPAPAVFDGGRLLLPVPEGSSAEERTRRLNAWYRDRFREALPAFTARMEAKTGLHAEEYILRDMSSRWGSCQPKAKRIRLNLKLVKYPPECLEYVLIHELTHLIIPNHSAEFWDAVAVHCPDWKQIRKTLNDL
jgi:predicted metal-dependent hydrolase